MASKMSQLRQDPILGTARTEVGARAAAGARDWPQDGRGAGWKDSRILIPGKIIPKARSVTGGAHGSSRAGAPTQACSEALLKLIASYGLG